MTAYEQHRAEMRTGDIRDKRGVRFQVGDRFSRLRVVELFPPRLARCVCDCGQLTVVRRGNLRAGHTKSCGCLLKETSSRNVKTYLPQKTHGHATKSGRTREYIAWRNIKARCGNPKSHNYGYYGARGISVCEKWARSFEAFLEDVGKSPSPQHSIDRIDNDGNYEPGNCRWATRQQQMANRRPNGTALAGDYNGKLS